MHKENCETSLAGRILVTAQWRLSQQQRFPADTRNGKAAKRLFELAEQVSIPDSEWGKLATYYNEFDNRWLAAVSTTNRDIGFRRYPADFSEYLNNLSLNLKH